MAGRTVQCLRLLLLGRRNPLLAPAGGALPARTRFVGQLQLGQWWGRGVAGGEIPLGSGYRVRGGGDGEGEGEGDERSAESGREEQEDEMSLEAIVPNQHAIALFAGFLVVVINAHIAVTCRGNTSLVQFSSDSSHHCIRQLS